MIRLHLYAFALKTSAIHAEIALQGFVSSSSYFLASYRPVHAELNHDHKTEFPLGQPQCPTTECRWDFYSTSGVCAKLRNVTNNLNDTIPDHGKQYISFEVTGAGYSTGDQPFSTVFPNWTSLETGFLDFHIIYNLTATGLRAFRTTFYYCVQEYNVSVRDNVASHKLLNITADRKVAEVTNGTQTALKAPREPGVRFPYTKYGTYIVVQSQGPALDHPYLYASGEYALAGTYLGRTPSLVVNALTDDSTPSDMAQENRDQ